MSASPPTAASPYQRATPDERHKWQEIPSSSRDRNLLYGYVHACLLITIQAPTHFPPSPNRDYAPLSTSPREFPTTSESSAYLSATPRSDINEAGTPHRSQQHISQHSAGASSSTENDATEMLDANAPAQLPSIQRLNSCTSSSSSSGVVTNFHSKSLSQNQSCESSQSNFSTFESLDLNDTIDLNESGLPQCAANDGQAAIAAMVNGNGATASASAIANDNTGKDNGMSASLFAQNRYVIRSI